MNKVRNNKKGLQVLFGTDIVLAILLIAASLFLIYIITNGNLAKAQDTVSMPRDASINLQQLQLFVQTPIQVNKETKPVYGWLNEYFRLEFSTDPNDVVIQLAIKDALKSAAKDFLSQDAGQTLLVTVFKRGVVYQDIPLLDLTHYNYGSSSIQTSGFSGTYHMQLPAYFNQLLEEPDTYEIVVSLGYSTSGFRTGARLDDLYDVYGYSEQGSIV